MPSQLAHVGDDLILLIMDTLSQRDLVNASHVFGHWRTLIIQTPWLWRAGQDYRKNPRGTIPLSVVVQRSQLANLTLEGVDTALYRHALPARHRVVSLKIQITSTEHFPQLRRQLLAGLPCLKVLHFGRNHRWESDLAEHMALTSSGVAEALHERNLPSLIELYVFHSHLPLELVVLPKLERVRIEIGGAEANVSLNQLPQMSSLRSLVLETLNGYKLQAQMISPLRRLEHLAFSDRNDRNGSSDRADVVMLPIRDIECMQDLPIMKLVEGMRKACDGLASGSALRSSRFTRRGWIVTLERWRQDSRYPYDVYAHDFGVSITLSCSLTGARRTMKYSSIWEAFSASWDRVLGIREARTVHVEDVVAWSLFCNRSGGAENRIHRRRVLRLRITLRGGPREEDGTTQFSKYAGHSSAPVPLHQLRTLIIRAEPFTNIVIPRADIEYMLKAQFGWDDEPRTKLVLIGLEVRGWKGINLRDVALPDWAEDSEDEADSSAEKQEEDDDLVQEPVTAPVMPKISGTELAFTYFVLFIALLYSIRS